MQRTRLCFTDSFKSARLALDPLFGESLSKEQVSRMVRKYVLHRSRRMQERQSASQQRSWVRGNVSLVLQEAKRRRNAAVAEAALLVALEEKRWVEHIDVAWVKDAIASCGSNAELRSLAQTALQHPRLAGSEPSQLVATLIGPGGSELANLGSATQLGSEEDLQSSLALLADEEGGGEGEATEETVALALSGARVPMPAGRSLLSDRDRSLAALSRLQAHRDEQSITANVSFTRYFMRQGIVRSESELLQLFQAMRARPAELGFRVQLSHPLGRMCAEVLRGRDGVSPVTWLPPFAGAFTLHYTNEASADALARSRQLLRALGTEGTGRYQSLSSMLPVHFLSPQPHEAVLDLCAAPGSKAALIVDYMQQQQQQAGVPRGCVVANEADGRRSGELDRRLHGLSPAVLTIHASGEELESDGMQFDKVLVDAPCTGEGRMGRDAMAWRLWHPSKGLEFFPRQLALLNKAVSLCRQGGRVVYATCTLNPIENEAVVAAALRAARGTVRIVPPPPLLGSTDEGVAMLQLDSGMRSWYVPSRDGGFFADCRDAHARGERISSDCFCPSQQWRPDTAERGAGADAELENAIASQLQNCRRILPHHNNGHEGFFIAVLEKTGAVSVSASLPNASSPLGKSLAGQLPQSLLDATTFSKGRSHVHSDSGSNDNNIVSRSTRSLFYGKTGTVALPFSYASVVSHLAPFFSSPEGMSTSLQANGLSCLWEDGTGLRLITDQALDAARSLRAPVRRARTTAATAVAAAHEMGVVAFTAQGGALTSAGAHLLRRMATRRVVVLPRLAYLHLLLSYRTMELDEKTAVAVGASVASHSALLRGAQDQAAAQRAAATAWVAKTRAQLAQREGGNGNVIVCVADDDTDSSLLAELAIPARVDHCESAAPRLQLLLSPEERQRLIATINRLHATARVHARRAQQATRERLHETAHLSPSATMPESELHGTAAAPSALLVKPSPPKARQSRFNDGEDAFEV